MRKLLFALTLAFAALSSTVVSNSQTVHDTVRGYFESLSTLPPDSIASNIDLLIAQGETAKVKADIAGLAFDFFSSSPVMGHDGVAVHIADNWFLNKKLEWSNPETYPLLYTYAEFNRNSLIGMQAPELTMETLEGERISTRTGDGSYKLLFFYDEMCPTCLEQTDQLAEMLRHYKGEALSVYAVNSLGNRDTWAPYVAEHYAGVKNGKKLALHHLTDPEDTNDYRRKYGVLKTPAMVLIDPDNVIVGRQLDCSALAELLKQKHENTVNYKHLFDGLLEAASPADSADVVMLAAALAEKTEKDGSLYREMMFEFYKYLRGRQNFEYQKGAACIGTKYICNDTRWSEELRNSIREDIALFRTGSIGDKAVNVTVRTADGRKCRMLKGRPKYTLIVFHLVTCGDCKREIKILRENAEKLKAAKVKVVCVHVGMNDELHRKFIEANPKGWTYLNDDPAISGLRHKQYDIRYVPEIYLLDRNRKIIARDYEAICLSGIVI